MFVPCDRRVHVSGHVFDSQHKPIGHAKVEFYGSTQETDERGCFYFGGLLAAPGFNVTVSKSGYKPYREGKEFDYYDIEVTLAPDNSNQQSSGSWRKLNEEELSKYRTCSGS
jgi:hypothetical protein